MTNALELQLEIDDLDAQIEVAEDGKQYDKLMARRAVLERDLRLAIASENRNANERRLEKERRKKERYAELVARMDSVKAELAEMDDQLVVALAELVDLAERRIRLDLDAAAASRDAARFAKQNGRPGVRIHEPTIYGEPTPRQAKALMTLVLDRLLARRQRAAFSGLEIGPEHLRMGEIQFLRATSKRQDKQPQPGS